MNVLILGSNGRLGSALARRWKNISEVNVLPLARAQIDLSDPRQAEAELAALAFGNGDVVINCAATTDVDRCERDP